MYKKSVKLYLSHHIYFGDEADAGKGTKKQQLGMAFGF
jgi:hypothetical protein